MLAAQEARTHVVHPVYVAAGLAWEEGEQRIVEALLCATAVRQRARTAFIPSPASSSACATSTPPTHWALTGTPPAYDTPDEDVYLHGRNVALLSKAAVYAATRKISRLVVAPLAGNPFPDATPQFFSAFSSALSLGLATPIEIAAPFARPAQRGRGEDRR